MGPVVVIVFQNSERQINDPTKDVIVTWDKILHSVKRGFIWFILGIFSMHLKSNKYIMCFYVPQLCLPLIFYLMDSPRCHDLFLNVKFFAVWVSMLVHLLLRVDLDIEFPLKKLGTLILWTPNLLMVLYFDFCHFNAQPYVIFNLAACVMLLLNLWIHFCDRDGRNNAELIKCYKIDEDKNIIEFPFYTEFFYAIFFIAYWHVVMTFLCNHLKIAYTQLECMIGCLLLCMIYGVQYFAQIRVANLYPWCCWTLWYMETDVFEYSSPHNTIVIDSFAISDEYRHFTSILNVVSFMVVSWMLLLSSSIPYYFPHNYRKDLQDWSQPVMN